MNVLSPSLRIGVLRGGPSSEYDVSLKTGANVLEHLSETHNPIDIFISRDGKWHMHGVERSPERILKNVDVVFNALHGEYGEDGQVQGLLDHHGVAYTGSRRYPSAIAMNKWMTKDWAIASDIKIPVSHIVRKDNSLTEKAKEIWSSIPSPLIVKPVSGGSSFGLRVVRNYGELYEAVEQIVSSGNQALVEEYIPGREATCGVIDNFRGKSIYSLPVVEIIPPEGKLFDYDAKYNGKSQEICPGNFSLKEKKEIERLSSLIHEKLGLSHYSRSDFIVSPRRGIYFLEVNTLPGLTSESLLPKALNAIGVSMKDFIHHVISLALKR